MEFDDFSGRVMGCAIEVHRCLGPVSLESVHRRCLTYGPLLDGVTFREEMPLPLQYKDIAFE